MNKREMAKLIERRKTIDETSTSTVVPMEEGQSVITEEKPEVKPEIKSFLSVTEPSFEISPLTVLNPNLNYEYRWRKADKMSNNRYGDWVAVDRKHPDFKGLSVPIDHSPDQSYIKYKDCILCCIRRETFNKKKRLKEQRNARKSKMIREKYDENVNKLTRSLGDRREAIRATKDLDVD